MILCTAPQSLDTETPETVPEDTKDLVLLASECPLCANWFGLRNADHENAIFQRASCPIHWAHGTHGTDGNPDSVFSVHSVGSLALALGCACATLNLSGATAWRAGAPNPGRREDWGQENEDGGRMATPRALVLAEPSLGRGKEGLAFAGTDGITSPIMGLDVAAISRARRVAGKLGS